jgi:uncharacterized membrane protein
MAKKQDNVQAVSILSYFLIGIIWYFVDKEVRKSRVAKFHVKQALNLAIISIVISILFSFFGWFTFGFFYFVFMVVRLGLFVLWLIGLINAINMKQKEIPLVGSLAEKYLSF